MKQTNAFKILSERVSQIKFGKIPKKNRLTVVALAVAFILCLSAFTYFNGVAYAVKINGNVVGVVREQADFDLIIDSLKNNFYKQYSSELVFNETVEYEKTRAKDEELTSSKEMESSLKAILNLKVKAYEIKANGKSISILQSKADAEKVLEEVQKAYKDDEGIEEIYFGENVVIEETTVEMKDIKKVTDTVSLIEKGTNEVKVHEVEKGENFWTISQKYNIAVEDLEKANPDINPDKIQIKQTVNLVVPKPLLTVVTTRRSRYEESIPFPIEFEETSALFKGETKIKVAGKDGKREVLAEIVEHNNIEVTRNIEEEKIILEPKKQIVLKGTKEPPPKIGTGTFSNPTRGRLTSRFGSRWGRMHEGIDIAARIGTPVNAADGGKVVFAGTDGAYGKLVKIDHGGGFVTYYAHNSKLLVSKGDKVFKGQKIAEVGNTGRSTGPHLHFEVRKNGKAVNPLSYVKY